MVLHAAIRSFVLIVLGIAIISIMPKQGLCRIVPGRGGCRKMRPIEFGIILALPNHGAQRS